MVMASKANVIKRIGAGCAASQNELPPRARHKTNAIMRPSVTQRTACPSLSQNEPAHTVARHEPNAAPLPVTDRMSGVAPAADRT